MARPRILIAEDHALMAEGLRAMLEPEYDIVQVVRDGRDVVLAVDEHRPDLLLLDLSLPGKGGIEVLADLRAARLPVRTMILTMHADRIYADEALKAGATGYVLKLARSDELRRAIIEVLAGRLYVTEQLREHARPAGPEYEFRARRIPEDTGLNALTPRQQEVLRLIARGRTGPEIAGELGISESAVEFHRSRIRQALGLASAAALVRYAVSRGLV